MPRAQINIPLDLNSRALPLVKKGSGLITESGVVHGDNAVLYDAIVFTDGTNDATVTVYDNATEASGRVMFHDVVKGSVVKGGEVNIADEALYGLFIAISGTGAKVIVRYVDIT